MSSIPAVTKGKKMKINLSKFFAKAQTKFFRFLADKFFARRYGHRAVVLETIAGVPGMVAGMWIHLRSLRQMRTGYGPMIRELLAEAENERMHLMFFIEIAKPNIFERWLILAAQAIFWNYYFLLYVCSPKTAHLMVHYFEEEAVKSYTSYLKMVETGLVENVPAPTLAIDYYGLKANAKLSDLIRCVRADEQRHAVANAKFAEEQQPEQASYIATGDLPVERFEFKESKDRRDAA
jgi:ubiquinol oxidase|tara:strand:- start:741 stop:1448 length:708 start_codon:yes stop_codon:yes gene_type:complete